MADEINVNNTNPTTPEPSRVVEREDSSGWIVAVIILAIVALFLIFGLPALRGGNSGGDDGGSINIDADLPDVGGDTGGDTGGTPATE